MDIVRAFEERGLAAGEVTINIQGTPEEPLFQAKQIGELLGIAKIRNTIKDFDEDEAPPQTAHSMGGFGGSGRGLLITELGLYRLMACRASPSKGVRRSMEVA